MHSVTFDFTILKDREAFYDAFAKFFQLPSYFGRNLDALWDVVVSSELPLPLEIRFIHIPQNNIEFEDLILLFEQAEDEMDGALCFRVG